MKIPKTQSYKARQINNNKLKEIYFVKKISILLMKIMNLFKKIVNKFNYQV